MNRVVVTFLCLAFWTSAKASHATDYVKRFSRYLSWHEMLPETPTLPFLAFIQEKTPLATKLREQWLYQLGQNQNWPFYKTFYQPTLDKNLSCYYALALYHTGSQPEALLLAHQLWQSATIDPPVCRQLFSWLFSIKAFDETVYSERIRLALTEESTKLLFDLLKNYKKEPGLATMVQRIHRHPALVNRLPASNLRSDLYLYGLKRLIITDIKKAAWLGLHPKWPLSASQKEAFIKKITLFKALRHEPDHSWWFQQLTLDKNKSALLDWEIRAALGDENWPEVERLINRSPRKSETIWRYWQARAKAAQGKGIEAREIYQGLALEQHYYGFLAAQHLKQDLPVNQKPMTEKGDRLKPYMPILEQIRRDYTNQNPLAAARLLHDFNLELPAEDRMSLLLWLSQDLKWTHQALYLANREETRNQLELRFPLSYQNIIILSARHFHHDEAYIYAIIRQESLFKAEAESEAGAKGLMQILPDTAAMLAKREKIAFSHSDQLYEPEKNIALGAAYLNYLNTRFRHPLLITAAYNAGPKQVNSWLKSPVSDPLIWIETLPWAETRNYIKNVIAFYAVYQYRLHRNPNIDQFLKPFEITNDKTH